MYEIPQTIDKSLFLSTSIQQVCFTANTITIHFNKDVFIVIHNHIRIRINDECYTINAFPPTSNFVVLKLIEKEVLDLVVNEERDIMQLLLEDNIAIEFVSDGGYESFDIYTDGKRIII